jgi:hypothetical protein
MEEVFDMTWITQPHNNTLFAHLVSLMPPVNMHAGPWIAGGSARKLAQQQPFESGDVDVFFAAHDQRLAWTQQFESMLRYDLAEQPTAFDHCLEITGLESDTQDGLFIKPKKFTAPYCYKKLETDNADTYGVYFELDHTVHDIDVQLIKTRYAPTLLDLWRDFDFTISCYAADAHTVYHTASAAEDLDHNRIVINNALPKRNLALRVIKHHAYGFDVAPELLMEASQLIANGEYEWNEIY